MVDTTLLPAASWQATHEALTQLARARAGLDFEEGKMLRAAKRARVHERLGYGGFVEYVERLFGYSPRLTLEKLRVADALDSLPQLAEALRDGTTNWSSLRELTRVATRETETAWLTAARGRTMRDVERLVSGHRPGDLPGGRKDSRLERHVLRFEVSGEVLSSFREAFAKLRRDAGGHLDDDATLLLMARHVLEGPADDGRASYQVAITVCEACARATQAGRGEALPISPEVAEMAHCDAQRVRYSDTSRDARAPIEALVQAHVGREIPARMTPAKQARRRPEMRATQTVPPAVRRAVLGRDQHRCQVPGCRHATFVDVHHLQTREDGGGHEPDNLLTLCAAHHRACHRGELLIDGHISSGLQFRHADGTPYGKLPSAAAVDVTARAFRALRNLGFGERDVRDALRDGGRRGGEGRLHGVGEHTDEDDHDVEGAIRRALERLTRKTFKRGPRDLTPLSSLPRF